MTTATIIGANSYIARNLNKLYGRENEFFLYDRDEEQFDGQKNYRKVDLLNDDDWEKINFASELIYLFSGRTGTMAGFSEYDSFIDINEKVLLKLLETYRQKNSKAKIIFPSTRLVYRGRSGRLRETAAKEFKTVYAMNKFSCENYLKMYAALFGVKYCVFRICVPYGSLVQKRGSYGTIEFFLAQAQRGGPINIYGEGKQRRTFTHIKDLCRVLWEGGRNEACVNDVYNVGGADELSIGEVAAKIAAAYGVGVRNVPWPEEARLLESGDTVFDSRKLDDILHFKAEMTIEQWMNEGLRREKQDMSKEVLATEQLKNGGL